MSATGTLRRTHPRTALVVGLALGLGSLAACSGGDEDDDTGGAGGGSAAARSSVAMSVRQAEQRILARRARAVRTGDRRLFLASVTRRDPAFRHRQNRLFTNLRALPLRRYAVRVTGSAWPQMMSDPRWGPARSVPRVETIVQLRGFDRRPEETTGGLVFAREGGRLRLVSDRDAGGRPFPGSRPAPWDLTRVYPVRSGGVLALFDRRTRPGAPGLVREIRSGARDIDDATPFVWNARVVAYVFADRQVLDSLDSVPGGNIQHLGALTFPVYAAGGRVAGMRFTLLPSSMRAGGPFLERIIRHELTHVALGQRDDKVPTWLAEGLAEYLSARDLPAPERRIASVAVDMARRGPDTMPASRDFNGPDQDWHYALAWMACDQIASTQGEQRLWELVRALHQGGRGTPDDRQDAVLRRVLGYDSHRLAQLAGRRILRIYG